MSPSNPRGPHPRDPQRPRDMGSPQGPQDTSERRAPDPALDELRGLWSAVQPPALPPEDLTDADPTTRAAAAWMRAALVTSTAPCPSPAERRLPTRRPRPAWRRPAAAAAALLLALSLGLQRFQGGADQDPLAQVASSGTHEPDGALKGAHIGPKGATSSTESSAPDSDPAPTQPPRGLAARPSDAGLELRSGPVRLTFITSPKTL